MEVRIRGTVAPWKFKVIPHRVISNDCMLLVGTFTVANNHIKKLAGRQEYKNSQARVKISLTNYIYLLLSPELFLNPPRHVRLRNPQYPMNIRFG